MNKQNYLSILEERCGREASWFHIAKADQGPPIALIGFDGYPQRGRFTYFSHGLHLVEKPEWRAGRPEYFLCIDSPVRGFASFFGFLLSSFAFEKVMGWNTLVGAGDDDAINGHPYRRIALGPPCYLNWTSYSISDGSSLPINLGMAYLISNADFEEARQKGFGFLDAKSRVDHDYWAKIQTSVERAGGTGTSFAPRSPEQSP